MGVRVFHLLLALLLSLGAGCGRFGFQYLQLDASFEGNSDAEAEPDPDPELDADLEPVPEPDAEVELDGQVELDADTDADVREPDAALLDAGGADADAGEMTTDAAGLDAASSDAGADAAGDAGDAGPDAAPDASVPECLLSAAGSQLGYAAGEVGRLQGTYTLSLGQTGLCAAPAGCAATIGAQVVQSPCDLSACTMWESFDVGSGYFALRNVATGACMYMPSPSDGSQLISWECGASNTERWRPVCAASGGFRLFNELSGKPLQGAAAPGTGIVQQPESSSMLQLWTLSEQAAPWSVVLPTSESAPGQSWRYTTATPAGTWVQVGFDDRAWATGAGAFGDQARGFTAVRTSWTSGDIWLRRSFALASLPANLSVRVYHDEDVEVFINGVQAFSEPSWSQGYRTVAVPGAALSALRVGSNTIAVHCHNNSAPQFVDVGLIGFD